MASGEPNDREARSRAALTAAALFAYGSMAGPKGSLTAYDELKTWIRGRTERDPMDAAVSTTLLGGVLFYLAEKGHNPKINSVLDGILYVATSLSVGYAETHPQTGAGKALAAFVQTIGPNLAARALDAPSAQPIASAENAAESLEVQKRILERLDAIHAALTPK